MQYGNKETVCIVSTEVDWKGHSGEAALFHLLYGSHISVFQAVHGRTSDWNFVHYFIDQIDR